MIKVDLKVDSQKEHLVQVGFRSRKPLYGSCSLKPLQLLKIKVVLLFTDSQPVEYFGTGISRIS